MINNNLKRHLVRDSAILWVSLMLASFSNYIFHLLMGRYLGPANYGILASLVSLFYLMTIPTATIQIVASKYGAESLAKKEYAKIHFLFVNFSKRLFLVGAVLFVIFVLASRQLSDFLKISSVLPVILLSSTFLVDYTIPINRGILQGLFKFDQLSFNLFLEIALKIIIALALVGRGMEVSGAIIGLSFSVFVAYGASFLPLRFLFKDKADYNNLQFKDVITYSKPVFISIICLTSFYTIDTIIVKHFFSDFGAGLYSGLAILGKVVIFASISIAAVMFPIVAALRREEVEEQRRYLTYSLSTVIALSTIIVTTYFLIPKNIINLFLGVKYLSVAPYAGTYGVVMFLLSIASIFVYFLLAIHRTGFILFIAIMAIIQSVLIWFFHESINQIMLIMIIDMLVLIVGLVSYYFVSGAAKGNSNDSTT